MSFLDQNRTIYGYDQTSGDVISASHPVMGTVTTVQLPAGSKCSDARAAFGTYVRPAVVARRPRTGLRSAYAPADRPAWIESSPDREIESR